MRSAGETRLRRGIENKLSILILLWLLDKVIMLLMLIYMK